MKNNKAYQGTNPYDEVALDKTDLELDDQQLNGIVAGGAGSFKQTERVDTGGTITPIFDSGLVVRG